ncbi:hypothetical protein D3C84_605870 [compost metagenome]
MRRQTPALSCFLRVQVNDLRALVAGIAQVTFQACQVTRVDDRAVVRVVSHARVKAMNNVAVGRGEVVQAFARHQHVVRCYAGLSGIQGFAEGNALGGVGQGHTGRDNGWRFTAQFQGYRGQVLCCRQHHMAADTGGAGE